MGRQYATVHKTYGFSNDWQVHSAITYFTPISQCIPITFRGLFNSPRSSDRGRVAAAHPSEAAGLTDHVRSLTEWLTFLGVQLKEDTT